VDTNFWLIQLKKQGTEATDNMSPTKTWMEVETNHCAQPAILSISR